MRNLFVLWVMALMLVLLAGTGAVALEDPFLDGIFNPNSTTIDDGSEGDDHPWGGDQSPGTPTPTVTRPTRLLMTTGILPIDQFIAVISFAVTSEVPETGRVSSVSSTAITEKRPTHYTDGVRPSHSFSNKRGVSR